MDNLKKVFIFLGPPGCGKGTQTTRLSQKLDIPHVDTGSLLRKNIQDNTPFGIEAKKYIDKGQLVPIEVVQNVIKDRIKKDDCKDGFILDGFPRSVEQADALKGILKEVTNFNLQDDALAIYFDIENEVLIQRLVNRRSCPKCGMIYNLISSPPKIMNYCDICDTQLVQRKDDNEETARLRFETYENETKPLLEYFENEGILKEINADAPITDVWESIKEIIFEEE